MKRRRLVGKQPPSQAWCERGTPASDTEGFKQVWCRGLATDMHRLLGPSDWCELEAVSRLFTESVYGTNPWYDLYVDRFGVPAENISLDCVKIRYISELLGHSMRIVPGERAAGICIGYDASDLRTKPCHTITPRYNQSFLEYIRPGQGYRYLQFKASGGPVKSLDDFFSVDPRKRDKPHRFPPRLDLPVAFEDMRSYEYDGMHGNGHFHIADHTPTTDFTGQALTIWIYNSEVSAIGVHVPWLGDLGIMHRPELVGIRVGISCADLFRKVGASIDDIIFRDSNPGGPTFLLDMLDNVSFEVDAENGGTAEVDDFTCYQDIEWLRPRLHYPISGIFIW